MYSEQIIAEIYSEPTASVSYQVSRAAAQLFPGRAIVEGFDSDFTPLEFARAGRCVIRPADHVHSQVLTHYRRDSGALQQTPHNAWFEVEWEGHELDALVLTWGSSCTYSVVAAETRAVAEGFFRAVCAFEAEVEGEVLVFDDGDWERDEALFRGIRASTREDLVLEPALKAAVFGDLARFFAGRETYERHKIPWKRGLLLTGPPGNGKTHAVKALVRESGRPCLYVRNFDDDPSAVGRVFARARRAAPCVLVLEDLDSLVDVELRSPFLNEMDGFAENRGLVVLATTNHPEKLDPALADRPSRFDRKYHFGPPGPAERRAYLARWADSWDPAMRPSFAAMEAAVARSEGLSFASLKEACLSAMMAWIEAERPGSMDAILLGQVEALRAGRPEESGGAGPA